jgi:hypothetical protein
MAMTLDDLVREVRSAGGTNVLAVVLYGSAAGRDYHAAGSDQNVLILMDDVGVDTLTTLAPVVRRWVGVGNPPPLLMSRGEWLRRADVFAMEYSDMLERHRVLFGEFPTADITVATADLRRQLESEAMGKLLRFRRGVMSAGGDAARLKLLVEEAFPALQALLRGVLHLHGEAAAGSTEDVVQRAALLAGFDPAPVVAVVAHRRGTAPLRDDAVAGVVAGYLAELTAIVQHVDSYDGAAPRTAPPVQPSGA